MTYDFLLFAASPGWYVLGVGLFILALLIAGLVGIALR